MFKRLLLLGLVSLGITQDDPSVENETITKLDLSNKGLTSLNDYDFSKYPQLEELDLSNNLIENINEDIFIKNKKLKKLNLSGNTRLLLPQFSTLVIADIEELNLSNCNIEILPPSILDGLIQLKVIDLSDNPVTSIKLITFTNLLSPEKLILPSLLDKKIIKEICNELNITIEDVEETLQCADVRNDKWEGVKKPSPEVAKVDTPVNSTHSEEKTDAQSDTLNAGNKENATDVNLADNKEGGSIEPGPPNVPDVTNLKEQINTSDNNDKNEIEIPEAAEGNKKPNSTEGNETPKAEADEQSGMQDTEPDMTDAQLDKIDTPDQQQTINQETSETVNSSKEKVLKTTNTNSETTNEADSKKTEEIVQPQKLDSIESQGTNEHEPENSNNTNDEQPPNIPDAVGLTKTSQTENTQKDLQPVAVQEQADNQNAANEVQEVSVPAEKNEPSSVVSNNSKEIEASKSKASEVVESSPDQEKTQAEVPAIDPQQIAPIPQTEAPINQEETKSEVPAIGIQRIAPLPRINQEEPKPDVPDASVQRSIPAVPQVENKQTSENNEPNPILDMIDQVDQKLPETQKSVPKQTSVNNEPNPILDTIVQVNQKLPDAQKSVPTAPQVLPQIENKQINQVPSLTDQVVENSKVQDNKQAQQVKREETSEVATGASTSTNTGTNILIFLVIAVVISGVAAFGYRFYKTRNYRVTNTQEPIERELQEIVTDKRSNGPTLTDVIEEEPLMQKNENSIEIKEVDESKEIYNNEANHISTNSKPYVPIETISTPENKKLNEN